MTDRLNSRLNQSSTTEDQWEIHTPSPYSPATQLLPQPQSHSNHIQQRQQHNDNNGDSNYVVYLRFPFPRNGFVDPPQAHWNADKERRLWEYLSRTLRRADIDWGKLAQNFDVPLPFILKQAAWLYEKELEQVRLQMQRVIRPNSSSPKPSKVATNPREKERTVDSLDKEGYLSPTEDHNQFLLRHQTGSGGKECQSPGHRVSFFSQIGNSGKTDPLQKEENKQNGGEDLPTNRDEPNKNSKRLQSSPLPSESDKVGVYDRNPTRRIGSPITNYNYDVSLHNNTSTNKNADCNDDGDYEEDKGDEDKDEEDDDDDEDDDDYGSFTTPGYGFESVRLLASSAILNKAPLVISDDEDDGAFLPIDSQNEDEDEEQAGQYLDEDGDKFGQLNERQHKLKEENLGVDDDPEAEAERERAAKILDSSLRNFADPARRSIGHNQKYGEDKLTDSALQEVLDARLR